MRQYKFKVEYSPLRISNLMATRTYTFLRMEARNSHFLIHLEEFPFAHDERYFEGFSHKKMVFKHPEELF